MKSVREYYDSTPDEEYNRLAPDRPLHYQLEFERTIEQLQEFLPESGHILDAGGGSGRYTEWLTENGYTVTLLDLSRPQLQKARDTCPKLHTQFCHGSITDLPFNDSEFDAVVCTGGPISHLISKTDRESALEEFCRVGRAGSPVFISVMGLINALQNLVQGVPEFDQTPLLPEFALDGKYTQERASKTPITNEDAEFTACKFFRADEFRTLLERSGITVTELIGLESITYGIDDSITDEQEHAVRETVEQLESQTDTIAEVSPHMLAVGHI